MKFLMDTHAFIWYHQDAQRLSATVAKVCQDKQNTLYLSMVSVWEMQIKISAGKLRIVPSLEQAIQVHLDAQFVELMPIQFSHILALQLLSPRIHHDPFDHLLIAQSLHEKLTLITDDAKITAYAVPTLW